jgi:lactate dehydrogenase-like 2-hydroxyacid dehydrogenase
MHHEIVALEGLHLAIPEFDIAPPHTATQTVHHNTSPSELHDRIKTATIIITTTVKLDANTLSPSVTPQLQHIAVMASGTDCVDIEAAKKRGISVSNCLHGPTDVVSEHAIALYFAARRKTVLMHGITRTVPSEWKAKGSVVAHMKDPLGNAPLSCADEVCGIIGYGALGMPQVPYSTDIRVGMVLTRSRQTSRPSSKRIRNESPHFRTQKRRPFHLCLPTLA